MRFKNTLSLFCFTLLLGTMSFMDGQAKRQNEATPLVEQMNAAFKLGDSGDVDAAVKELSEVAKEAGKAKNMGIAAKAEHRILILYYRTGNYDGILKLADKTIANGKKAKDYLSLSNAYRFKGLALYETGFLDESLRVFNQALSYNGKIEENDERYMGRAVIYDNIASYFDAKLDKDSMFYYIKKTVRELDKVQDTLVYGKRKFGLLAFEKMNLGMEYSDAGDYDQAMKYFNESLEVYESRTDLIKADQLILYSEMARSFLKQNKLEEAKDFALRGIALEKRHSSPSIRKTLYETLSKTYVNLGEAAQGQKYLGALTVLNDSLSTAQTATINTAASNLKKLQAQKTRMKVRWIVGAFAVLLVIGFVLVRFQWLKRDKIYKELVARYHKQNEMAKTVSEEKITADHEKEKGGLTSISDDTLNALLEGLHEFETSKTFLKAEVNQAFLTSYLGTNSKYLATVLKENKRKSFTQYINDLRIDYITECLYKKPKYRKYKVSYLAELCGFSSREVFTSVFKKRTGISPSFFINKLMKEEPDAMKKS